MKIKHAIALQKKCEKKKKKKLNFLAKVNYLLYICKHIKKLTINALLQTKTKNL